MTGSEPRRGLGVGGTIGHYRIDSVLGVGGMGMVFRATDQRLGRQVALKVVLAHHAWSPELRRRFQHEAAVLARLDSPHVITIYDHGEHDGQPFIVTQYAEGGDLGQTILTRGPLPPALAAAACAQVADALSAAHAVGVIHRDVKPANVLLRDHRPDRLHVYLCDFGVAHAAALGSVGLTAPGSVAGTWNYLAPERARGGPGSPATDIYAVGCLLWETLTGRPPYAGSDVEVAMAHLHEPVPQLPGDDDLAGRANQVLARAMAKDPSERHSSADELRDELRSLSGVLHAPTPTSSRSFSASPSSAPTLPGVSSSIPGRAGRGRLGIAIAALVVVAAGAAGAAVLRPWSGDEEPAPPPPVAVPAPAAVTGDLDGDGLGDFATLTDRGGHAFYADGNGGFVEPAELPGARYRTVTGDVDADGRTDLIGLQDGEGSSFSGQATRAFTVLTATGKTRTRVATLPIGIASDVWLMAGDVDGDDHDDVTLVSRFGDQMSATVLLGRPDGTLGRPKTWFRSFAADTELVAPRFVLGDVTGDGLADLVYTDEGPDAPAYLQLVASTGEAFERQGEPTVLEASATSLSGSWFGWFRVGDFDGDGADELGFLGLGPDLVVWRWTGGRFDGESWGPPVDEDAPALLEEASVTDVDGDGDDDWAFVDTDFVLRVYRSDGNRFELVDGPGIRVEEVLLGLGTLDPSEFRPV
ncbi:MAG: protein kinase [Nocardioides sp.]